MKVWARHLAEVCNLLLRLAKANPQEKRLPRVALMFCLAIEQQIGRATIFDRPIWRIC